MNGAMWGGLSMLDIAVRLVVTVWLIAISIGDHRNGIIPNRLTGPVLIVGAIWQIGYGALTLVSPVLADEAWRVYGVILAFAAVFALWMLHFIGGGDAKFLMALFALFPTMDFVAILALLLLVITLPLLLLELRREGLSATGRGFRDRLVTGRFLPSEEDLQSRGRRYAWTFAVPAAVYVWAYWDGIDQFRPGLTYLKGWLGV
jgi:Flp pilus assembly protein protease CpaA